LSPTFDTTINYYFDNEAQELTIPINNFDLSYWYVFNKQQLGYYRVNYDTTNWKSLSYALNSNEYSKIHIMNRVQLIDDSFALAQGGYIDLTVAYDILKYLDREDDFFPWYTCYRYLNSLFTVYGSKNEKLTVSISLDYGILSSTDSLFYFRDSSANYQTNSTASLS
jgi:aminopeptidase N